MKESSDTGTTNSYIVSLPTSISSYSDGLQSMPRESPYNLDNGLQILISDRDKLSEDYIKIADTIKRIICEKNNLTFDELEILKRSNPEFRKMHNVIGEYLGITSTLNR
jgi:hypothetical protein